MPQQATIGDRILEVVRVHPDCTLEEVTQQLPDRSWSDVCLEVDRLSRSGHLRLIQECSLGFPTSLRLP